MDNSFKALLSSNNFAFAPSCCPLLYKSPTSNKATGKVVPRYTSFFSKKEKIVHLNEKFQTISHTRIKCIN
jgi:hypothetical protein